MKRMIERRFTVTIVTDSMRNTANQALQSDEERNIVSLISCSSNVSGRYYLLKSKKKCIKVYKITAIVCVPCLAEMCVCMRVCKHGCGVKMFCTSCANHASTNLKKVLSWKLNKFTLFSHSLVWWNLENWDNRWFSDKMGRCMYERIKEHDRDIWLSQTQTSAFSEHANKTGHYPLWKEVKVIDRDSH